MATLNHTIVWCRDQETSAGFLTKILDLPPPRRFLGFLVVDLANDVSLDYMAAEGPEPIALQHFAFDPNGHLFELITRPYGDPKDL